MPGVNKFMKVLLSAYACEPNMGSEPGVGWNWALEIEKLGHEVWVITRSNNQLLVDTFFSNNKKPKNLHFRYYDLPNYIKKWKKGGRLVRSYYLLWQWGASSLAKKLHQNEIFDSVQHITFVSARQPSFMWRLSIPFIFGPVAGGERAPLRLRWNFGVKGFVIDLLRDIANTIVKFDPFMWFTFFKAKKIIVTSNETKNLIPKMFHQKVDIQLAIGIASLSANVYKVQNQLPVFKIIYIGRFIYWKGMYIGLSAFANVLSSFPGVRLTLVGEGPDKNLWLQHAKQLGISENLDWVDWVSQDELSIIYKQHDLLLFPSLHDSGGMVVLEAMSHGVPVACLNLGGPGVVVNDTCGIKIEVDELSESKVIDVLAEKIKLFITNEKNRKNLSLGALEMSNQYKWSNVVAKVYKPLAKL